MYCNIVIVYEESKSIILINGLNYQDLRIVDYRYILPGTYTRGVLRVQTLPPPLKINVCSLFINIDYDPPLVFFFCIRAWYLLYPL